MWSPSNLKRHQIDTEDECQHIFLEKRQRALRKKRKKVSAPAVGMEQYSLGNSHSGRLVSLPGLSKNRLTRKLSSLSNGVQGTVPAIRKVQQRLDHDLAHRQIDLNNLKGPPTYRNLPKPSLFEDNTCSRDEPRIPRDERCLPSDEPRLSRDEPRLSRDRVSRSGINGGRAALDDVMSHVMEQFDEMLTERITEAWPNLTYELELQAMLNNQITERLKARERKTAVHDPEVDPEVDPGSGNSSTTLTKPFSSWSIDKDAMPDNSAEFNKSFCRTIKRTFFKEQVGGRSPDHRPDLFGVCDTLDVSASALSLFEPKIEHTFDSGRGSSTDFLDTISDNYDPYTYHRLPEQRSASSDPDLVVRGVKKDFIDVVDSMYSNEFMKEQYLTQKPFPKPYITSKPVSGRYSRHMAKIQPMAEPYFLSGKENRDPNVLNKSTKKMKNRQFYLKKEWLK